jgi:hypothetical protein
VHITGAFSKKITLLSILYETVYAKKYLENADVRMSVKLFISMSNYFSSHIPTSFMLILTCRQINDTPQFQKFYNAKKACLRIKETKYVYYGHKQSEALLTFWDSLFRKFLVIIFASFEFLYSFELLI